MSADDQLGNSAELPCGRDALNVWERARQGDSDDHHLECTWCTAEMERAGLTRLPAFEAAGPHPADSEQLLQGVMQRVLNHLRPGRLLAVPDHPARPRRNIAVSEAAVSNTARALIDADGLAHATHVRPEMAAGELLQVEARVSIVSGLSAAAVTAAEERLRNELGTLLGLPVGAVRVVVEEAAAPFGAGTPEPLPPARNEDDELRELVSETARGVEGVIRIHTHETPAGETREDIGIVGLDITLRVVTGLDPSPHEVAVAVHDSVAAAVRRATAAEPTVTVHITDVSTTRSASR